MKHEIIINFLGWSFAYLLYSLTKYVAIPAFKLHRAIATTTTTENNCEFCERENKNAAFLFASTRFLTRFSNLPIIGRIANCGIAAIASFHFAKTLKKGESWLEKRTTNQNARSVTPK